MNEMNIGAEDLYPFVFEGNYKTALWGGERIGRIYSRGNTPSPCSESWEISGHPSSPSVVANGPFAGEDLASLVKKYNRLIVGSRSPSHDVFPLLFKLIDAKQRLSVQVHPNEKTALTTKGDPKTEMWKVLADPDCAEPVSIYAGLKPGATAKDVEEAISTGDFDRVIVEHKAVPGDAFFIRGGLVHAIGDNALIYEVQQSSDTTYRLYDWGRLGADGKPRELHVKESVQSIDYGLPVPEKVESVSCEFFDFKVVKLDGEMVVDTKGESFTAIFVASGEAKVSSSAGELRLSKGMSLLIPACVSATVSGVAECFATTV